MKNYILIIVTLIFLISLSTNIKAQETSEFIRYQIENRNIIPITAENDWIHCPTALSTIYENSIFSLAWKKKSTIDQLIKSIQAIDLEGLNPNDYHIDNLLKLNNQSAELSLLQKAHLDLLATDAFLLLTSDLLTGKVNLSSLDNEWHLKRREENQVLLFEEAIENNTIFQTIEESIPKHKVYLGLKEALAKYQKIKLEGGWEGISEGETLKKEQEDDRIVLVKNRLVKTNDLSIDSLGDTKLFDNQLLNAVLSFQKRHNLELDGNIGKKTIAAMNISVDERIDQIKVNLERWRWLPQEYSDFFIHVNIANFSVNVLKKGEHIKYYKAIVGKDHRKTPVFSSKISYLVLNPTWTVPSGIITKDIIPAVRKDVNYLKKKNFTVLDNKGNIIDPNTIDWSSPSAKFYTYRQPAGPDNALGAVKFMFPNSFSVYLHDTPSKNLFDKTERSFSSGCIRVENALQLAEYLLNDSVNWSLDKIKKQIDSKKTLTLPLKEQPEIYLLYWTAWLNKEGVVQFRNDIYDRDSAIIDALKKVK